MRNTVESIADRQYWIGVGADVGLLPAMYIRRNSFVIL